MKRILIIFLLFSLFGCQKLNEELDKVSGDIDQLEEQTIATINEQTTSINQDISALHSVQAAFQSEISSLKKDVAELETTMQTLRNERSRLLGEIEKLEEDAASVREDISDASNNINNHINTLKDAINKHLNELRLQVSSVENQISSLQQQDSKLRAEIELLTNKDKAIQESITALQSYVDIEIKEFSDAVAATYMTIEHYNGIIEQLLSLKTDIATWHTEIHSALDNAIAEVSDSLDYIKERTAAMEQLVESVVNGVESLIYIPIHEDGKATLYFSKENGAITSSYAELDFAVYPVSAATELAANWNKVLSVKVLYSTPTMDISELPITSVSAKDGVLSIMVDGATLNESVYREESVASLRLEVANGANTVTSKYVGLKRYIVGNITIPDEVFKGYLVENFDSNGDGEVSKSEVAAVQTIDVNGMNISSLAGIDYFVNLKSLNCSNTQVQHVDLSELTNLTSLDCSNSPIVNLEVSDLKNLETLECSHTKVKQLDLSELTNLTSLDCSHTKVKQLDLSELTNLTSLDCSNSPIVNLNVSYLAKLCTFDCSNTQVQQLNLSELTNLTSLDCSNTPITKLDVLHLADLAMLDCSNTQIQTLYCQGLSKLTSLNVGDCKLLTTLNCSNCALQSLDVSTNNALTKLVCHSNPNLTTLTCNNAFDFSTTHISINKGLDIISANGNILTPSVGDLITVNLGVGVVFSASNGSFKVVSVTEENSLWSTTDTQTSATDKNNGVNNMTKIKALSEWETKYPAFKWCSDYGPDWYLPALNELISIYENYSTIDSTLSANGYTTLRTGGSYWYWSSTEYSSYSAYWLNFSNGSSCSSPKDYSKDVRAVLAF